MEQRGKVRCIVYQRWGKEMRNTIIESDKTTSCNITKKHLVYMSCLPKKQPCRRCVAVVVAAVVVAAVAVTVVVVAAALLVLLL